MDKGTPGAHIITIITFTITDLNFIDILICRCTDGIIFVVDSSQPESLEEARVELWRTMRWEISLKRELCNFVSGTKTTRTSPCWFWQTSKTFPLHLVDLMSAR